MENILSKYKGFLTYLALGGLSLGMTIYPIVVMGKVLITEIMYAPEGADATHEWVEICNNGEATEDMSNWKFYENDTNHGLVLDKGSAELNTGECAIIADNSTSFKSDYLSFSGNLFDSAFSLKNAGETISIKNENGDIIDSITYSDTYGAKDNGNSLHINNSIITEEKPTPGDENTNNSNENTNTIVNTNTYSYETVVIEPPQDIYLRIEGEKVATVGALTKFEVESYDATGSTVKDGIVSWAFGDGGSAVGREVGHVFLYSGTYTVNVSIEKDSLKDNKLFDVTVVPLKAGLFVDKDGEWVSILNESIYPLDLSNWRLMSLGQYFIIPEGTIVSTGNEVRFSNETTKLSTVKMSKSAELVYFNGKIALRSIIKEDFVDEVETENKTESIKKDVTEKTLQDIVKPIKDANIFIPTNVVYKPKTDAVEKKTENKISSKATIETKNSTNNNTTQTASVILSKNNQNNNIVWYIAFVFLLAISIIATLFAKQRKLVVDGFEVIEEEN